MLRVDASLMEMELFEPIEFDFARKLSKGIVLRESKSFQAGSNMDKQSDPGRCTRDISWLYGSESQANVEVL